MTGIPTVTVEINFLNGPGWLNVTQWLDGNTPVNVRRGRAGQFETTTVGTASFMLENTYGIFTPGPANPFYAHDVVPNSPVRITVGSGYVFTGTVDELTSSVDDQGRSWTAVSCSDKLKNVDALVMGPYGIERQHKIAGGVTYSLAEAKEGDTSATFAAWRNTSPTAASIDPGSGGSYEFSGDSTGFFGGSLSIKPEPVGFQGPFVRHWTTFDPAGGGSLIVWFKANEAHVGYLASMVRNGTANPKVLLYLDGGTVKCIINNDAGSSYSITSSKTTCGDGDWHCAALEFTAGTYAYLHVDGTTVNGGNAGFTTTISSGSRRLYFGAFANHVGVGGYGFNGNIAAITSTTQAMTSTDYENIYSAGRWGESFDTISERITALFGFADPAASLTYTVANQDGQVLMGQDTNGKSLLSALNDIGDTQRGVTYCDGGGTIRFRGINARSLASVLTIDAKADLAGGGFTITTDDGQFSNRVTATGPTGSYTAQDTTSITAIGERAEAWTCIAYDLTGTANTRLAVRLANTPRIPRVTIDLLTATTASITTNVLALVPLDRVQIASLPSPPLAATTQDGVIEGWELSVSVSEFTVSLDLVPVG